MAGQLGNLSLHRRRRGGHDVGLPRMSFDDEGVGRMQ